MSERVLFAGLMSGTSLDGIDAALLELTGTDPESLSWTLLGFSTRAYSPEQRERLLSVIDEGSAEGMCRIHADLGEWVAEALLDLLRGLGIDAKEVAAVGSHGQTIWHEPPTSDRRGATLQLGCPATIAERTGIAVVSDFRSRDVAAGGQGAPLVPWADAVLFGRRGIGRALQNLGGMANVTFLPGDGGAMRAFDTGPGVALIDGAARAASGGALPFDVDGRRAASGGVNEPLLNDLLADPFFREPPPRSTGREAFGGARLNEIVARFGPETASEWDDLLATLTEFTARSVAVAYQDFLPAQAIDDVVLTGGGARNPALVDALVRALDPLPVRTGERALGMDPDAREAAAFALLAWAHQHGIAGSLPGVTGAAGPRVLGSFTPGRGT